MHKLSKLAAGSVIAAAAALGGAGMALADGYVPKKVAYERPSDWSGVYFGLGSGYQWSSIDVDIPGAAGTTFTVDPSNAIVSTHMGIQHQFGNIVLGVEGNWISTMRDEWGSTECPPVPSGLSCRARLNDILTIGGRAGWAAGHWMPYVTGGYASARFAHEVWTPLVGAVQTLSNSASTRNGGWYVGGGFEWVVSPGWTTGLEYRHYEFDSAIQTAITPAGVLLNDRRIDGSTDTITARVSWRWGREAAAVVPLK